MLKKSDLVPRWSEKAIKTLVTILRHIFVCHVRSDPNQLLGVWGKDCPNSTFLVMIEIRKTQCGRHTRADLLYRVAAKKVPE